MFSVLQLLIATSNRKHQVNVKLQTLKDNAQHAAGIVIGRLILRPLGVRYTKSDRGTKWFSTVAANLAANGDIVHWFPFGKA